MLGACLAGSILSAVLAVAIGGALTKSSDGRAVEMQARIARHRAALVRSAAGEAGSPLQLISRRKQASLYAVLLLDELAGRVPDNAYLTELRLEGDRLQIKGMTQDSSALIRELERAAHLAGLGFFAPTTRLPGEAGERFSVEGRVKPQFGPDP